LEYFRNEFPELRIAHIFQIFQILNERDAPQQKQFQKLQSQIRNQYQNIMSAQILQNQTQTQASCGANNPGSGQQPNVAGGGNPGQAVRMNVAGEDPPVANQGGNQAGPPAGNPGGNPGGSPGGNPGSNPGGVPPGNPFMGR